MTRELINFGSVLARYTVPEDHLERLNALADQLFEKSNPKLKMAERLASAVNREQDLPAALVPEFVEFLRGILGDYHRDFFTRKTGEASFDLIRMWVVYQYATEWNYLHAHSGDLAGVLYLRVPEDMAVGLPAGDKRAINPGAITFTEGTGGPYRSSIRTMKPKVGDLYLFPSELNHTVYPFFGDEERRSLSFNFKVNIANK